MKKEVEQLIDNDITLSKKHLYIVYIDGVVKIGNSINPNIRLLSIINDYLNSNNSKTKIDVNLLTLKMILQQIDFEVLIFNNKGHLEKQLHFLLSKYRINFKYKFSGYTEYFEPIISKLFSKYKHNINNDIKDNELFYCKEYRNVLLEIQRIKDIKERNKVNGYDDYVIKADKLNKEIKEFLKNNKHHYKNSPIFNKKFLSTLI